MEVIDPAVPDPVQYEPYLSVLGRIVFERERGKKNFLATNAAFFDFFEEHFFIFFSFLRGEGKLV